MNALDGSPRREGVSARDALYTCANRHSVGVNNDFVAGFWQRIPTGLWERHDGAVFSPQTHKTPKRLVRLREFHHVDQTWNSGGGLPQPGPRAHFRYAY
jgi:hypothetical protein